MVPSGPCRCWEVGVAPQSWTATSNIVIGECFFGGIWLQIGIKTSIAERFCFSIARCTWFLNFLYLTAIVFKIWLHIQIDAHVILEEGLKGRHQFLVKAAKYSLLGSIYIFFEAPMLDWNLTIQGTFIAGSGRILCEEKVFKIYSQLWNINHAQAGFGKQIIQFQFAKLISHPLGFGRHKGIAEKRLRRSTNLEIQRIDTPGLAVCTCWYKCQDICSLPNIYISPQTPGNFHNDILRIEKSSWTKCKLKTEQINTPLDNDFPLGSVTEFTEHVPISHWQESAVALASRVKRIESKKKKTTDHAKLR